MQNPIETTPAVVWVDIPSETRRAILFFLESSANQDFIYNGVSTSLVNAIAKHAKVDKNLSSIDSLLSLYKKRLPQIIVDAFLLCQIRIADPIEFIIDFRSVVPTEKFDRIMMYTAVGILTGVTRTLRGSDKHEAFLALTQVSKEEMYNALFKSIARGRRGGATMLRLRSSGTKQQHLDNC